MPVLPKSRAAPDMIFPQPRLGLVDPERNGPAQRGTVMFRPEPLLVETVAGLVQNSIKGLCEILLVVARRQAAVGRAQRGAERVGCGVNAAGVEAEADGGGNLAIEGLLRRDRVVALQQILGKGG